MALRSVVNRCANSNERIPDGSGLGQGLRTKNRLHFEVLLKPILGTQELLLIVTEVMITGSTGT